MSYSEKDAFVASVDELIKSLVNLYGQRVHIFIKRTHNSVIFGNSVASFELKYGFNLYIGTGVIISLLHELIANYSEEHERVKARIVELAQVNGIIMKLNTHSSYKFSLKYNEIDIHFIGECNYDLAEYVINMTQNDNEYIKEQFESLLEKREIIEKNYKIKEIIIKQDKIFYLFVVRNFIEVCVVYCSKTKKVFFDTQKISNYNNVNKIIVINKLEQKSQIYFLQNNCLQLVFGFNDYLKILHDSLEIKTISFLLIVKFEDIKDYMYEMIKEKFIIKSMFVKALCKVLD